METKVLMRWRHKKPVFLATKIQIINNNKNDVCRATKIYSIKGNNVA